MSANNHIAANTFQVFNAYVDRAMQHLTDGELRVLLYATRHIMGWQDKIASRMGHISLTMFEHGFTVKHDDGTESLFAGCGLGRTAISKAVKALVEFGLLEKVGAATEKGQKWRLCERPKWEKLEQRTQEQYQSNRKRVAKANAVKEAKKNGVIVTRTGSSDDTTPVSSDEPKQNHDQNHDQNQIAPPQAPDAQPPLHVVEKPKRKNPNEDWHHALARVAGHDPDLLMKNKTADGLYWKVAAELKATGITPEMIPAIYKYVGDKAKAGKWSSWGIANLSKYALDFLRDQQSPPSILGGLNLISA